jgi:hypothetical protein
VNPAGQGTKVAAHYKMNVGAGQTTVIRLRLSKAAPDQNSKPFGKSFDQVFADRLREADEFYKSVTPPSVSADGAHVMRQALAGMLWSKQFFFFDGDNWLDEHNSNPLHSQIRQDHTRRSRNKLGYGQRLRGSGSTRLGQPADPQVYAVRSRWLCGRLWNDICRRSRPDRDVSATVKHRNESKDGGNHGVISDPLDLLWLVDRFATSDRLELDCGVDQFF